MVLLEEKSLFDRIFSLFLSWWWVICFVLVCFVSYTHVSNKKMELYSRLSLRFEELSNKRELILKEKTELMQQINSQSDPLWIERVLMKGLGLVPEGQKKILFKDN